MTTVRTGTPRMYTTCVITSGRLYHNFIPLILDTRSLMDTRSLVRDLKMVIFRHPKRRMSKVSCPRTNSHMNKRWIYPNTTDTWFISCSSESRDGSDKGKTCSCSGMEDELIQETLTNKYKRKHKNLVITKFPNTNLSGGIRIWIRHGFFSYSPTLLCTHAFPQMKTKGKENTYF